MYVPLPVLGGLVTALLYYFIFSLIDVYISWQLVKAASEAYKTKHPEAEQLPEVSPEQ